MSKTLGERLKELRNLTTLTLRQVEEATGISNAYLSQLENDKIKHPSASILYKLSKLYNVDIDTLLIAAGIINPLDSETSAFYKKLPFTLTKQEEEELLKYLQFLRSSK